MSADIALMSADIALMSADIALMSVDIALMIADCLNNYSNAVSISSKTIHPPGTRLEGSKNLPPGTIIVHKNPPLGTEQEIKSPTPGT